MTAGERYITTLDIRAALSGHETELLDALNIPWRDGKPHIACPYRDHSDNNPSWRWDQSNRKAFCTCIRGSHSIFDVIIKVENIDFEEAKIRAAKILKREDLIRIRIGAKHYQRHDVQSLLNPSVDNRDDHLYSLYLASRLGIESADVPLATTPVIGKRGKTRGGGDFWIP
jgi:hypothetical protein